MKYQKYQRPLGKRASLIRRAILDRWPLGTDVEAVTGDSRGYLGAGGLGKGSTFLATAPRPRPRKKGSGTRWERAKAAREAKAARRRAEEERERRLFLERSKTAEGRRGMGLVELMRGLRQGQGQGRGGSE